MTFIYAPFPFKIFAFMYVQGFAFNLVCAPYACSALGGQEREKDLLEVESQKVVSLQADAVA